MSTPLSDSRPAHDVDRLGGLTLVLLVFATFVVYSAARAPVPGVNEPHYLTKAKHFWQPQWCAGDLFLESSNPHLLFYLTLGWLTVWLPLPWAAWVGRFVGLAVLALGWVSLLSCVLSNRRLVLWVTWLYLLVAACGNFSGEWIVGGIEAKVVSYGLAFLALGLWLRGRLWTAAVCAGLATSFHQVVGAWTAVCAALATVAVGFPRARSDGWGREPRQDGSADARRPEAGPQRAEATSRRTRLVWNVFVRQAVVPAALVVLGALPGLWAGLQVLTQGDWDLRFTANYIQVFYRLRHHLDPNWFGRDAYAGYALLLAGWLALLALAAVQTRGPTWLTTAAEALRQRCSHFSPRWFHAFVAGTCLLALVGLLVGLGPPPTERTTLQALRMTVLKLYPFRLFDAVLPLAVCCLVVELAGGAVGRSVAAGRFAWVVFAGVFAVGLALPTPDRNPSRMSRAQLNAWLDACRWVRAHTPTTALCLTPTHSWAFKWYAQRAEYVCFKDCPQDAAGIVEWNRRLRFLRQWAQQNYQDGGYSEDEVRQLCRQTGVTYIVVRRLGPFFLEPVYKNRFYRVYDVSRLAAP